MPAPQVLIRSEQSDGQVAMVRSTMPAGTKGPPLHTHDFDEAFYVLDGELLIQLDGELITARQGELAFAPGACPTRWPTTATQRRAF